MDGIPLVESVYTTEPAGADSQALPSSIEASHDELDTQRMASLATVFMYMENRWELWGKCFRFQDILGRERSHALEPYTTDPPQECSVCGAPAAWACPRRQFVLECIERHYACHICYEHGFNNHGGMLDGKHREYRLTILKLIFTKADVHKCGALDFFGFMLFWLQLIFNRKKFLPQEDELQAIQRTYGDFHVADSIRGSYDVHNAGGKGVGLAAVTEYLEDNRIRVPADLAGVVADVAEDGVLNFRGYVRVLYKICRPDSPYLSGDSPPDSVLRHRVSLLRRQTTDEVPELSRFNVMDIRKIRLLGQGGTSIAWLVEYQGHTLCAKCPKAKTSAADVRDMMRSARLQMTIKHRNVLRVLTVLETGPWPCILLEVAEMGDVSKWQVSDVDDRAKWKILSDVAAGVNALHTMRPPIIHRDIKGSNLLLTRQMVAKLADFDFAEALRAPHWLTEGVCGTPGYMAPEMLQRQRYGLAADVFSFGSMLYELTHQSYPFAKMVERDTGFCGAKEWFKTCRDLTTRGVRPELDPHVCPPAMRQLILDCWHAEPSERPAMAAVMARLEAMEHQFAGDGTESQGTTDVSSDATRDPAGSESTTSPKEPLSSVLPRPLSLLAVGTNAVMEDARLFVVVTVAMAGVLAFLSQQAGL